MVDSPGKVRSYRFRHAWRTSTRARVLATTGGRCLWCGWPGTDGKGKGMALAHRIPHDQGGTDDEANLVPACPPCHASWDLGRRVSS